MKHHAISLRRRHLMVAGLAAAAAPAIFFASRRADTPGEAFTARLAAGQHKLVVSGRIRRSDGKPLAGAKVEIRCTSAGAEPIIATTDADGRFMFTTMASTESTGRLRHLDCRVCDQGQDRLVTQLHFPRRGSDDHEQSLQRDSAGVWRASFGLTVA